MKHLGALLTILGLVACGGGDKGGSTTPKATGGLPSAYAAFFEPKTAEFPAELVTSEYTDDGTPGTKSTKGTVTCTTSNPRSLDGGTAIDVACTSELEMAGSLDGTYIGTADGLWPEDTEKHELDPEKRLLQGTPAASHIEHKEDPDGNVGMAFDVVANGKDWCGVRSGWGGDEGGYSICIGEGVGIVGGHAWFAGGSTRDLYFGAAPRDAAAPAAP